MLNREICSKCRHDLLPSFVYDESHGEVYPVFNTVGLETNQKVWFCPIAETSIFVDCDPPPAGCPRVFEHAIAEGMTETANVCSNRRGD